MKKSVGLTLSIILVTVLMLELFTVTALAGETRPVTISFGEKTEGNYSCTENVDFDNVSDIYYENCSNFVCEPITLTDRDGDTLTLSASGYFYYEMSGALTFTISASDWDAAAPGEYIGEMNWSFYGENRSEYDGEIMESGYVSGTTALTLTKEA